jgi:methanogenic corrinoid protein MtbC1
MSDDLTGIKKLLSDLEEEPLLALVKERLAANDDPMAIIEACREGMQMVGERFAAQEYFVSELVASAELFNEVMSLIGPRLPEGGDEMPKSKIVFGTVQGDIHDIGKNIVVSMLRCNNFEVYDLGVDVPPKVFVDKVRQTGATIIGLSGLLTVAFPAMKNTIDALKNAGLRDKTRVMIGGGLVDDFVRDMVGADAWGHDAMDAVKLAESFSEVKAE